MDERESLASAVRTFNGHAIDWRRVYIYVHRRSRAEFENPLDILQITEILEEMVPNFSDELWRFIEAGTEMLSYLREEGRS